MTDIATPTNATAPSAVAYVGIPQRVDFDALAPAFSRAVSDLNEAAIGEADRAGIDPGLRELIRLRASQLNGCAYCVDLHTRDAEKHGVSLQRIHAVVIWHDSPFFTAAERAALQLTEAVTRLSETHVPDAVVADALAEFDEAQVAALIALIVTINVWNGIGVTARCWTPRLRG
ncbi:carboxymuconolactone decarboxylase family protein [Protaetiibacter sp. SSC-01]|uniref:carboxymuconolactone decarboxylase family protein n=1 Tax=Protaetiibacter sp. SSC-01 TaxID=2759943 RepID=UPI0016570F06|nr:carboxymuconolactone decarboxylase family protein [Protaetiibacter sp. SSC-01]QNO36711.1 carboxymuconolactone decarboxylase family protein [Protaetiibacter sp. SSC-01]